MRVFVNGEEKNYKVIADSGRRLEDLDLGEDVEMYDYADKVKPFYNPIKGRVTGVDEESLYCRVVG